MKLSSQPFHSFADRHIGPNQNEIEQMLKTLGLNSVEELIDKTVPQNIRLQKELNLTDAITENELLEKLKKIGAKNKIFKNYIGLGYYDTLTPNVILRNIMENPGWYTQYTPYQAEISQGRLEALLNYQTAVIDLTGMEISNASLLDEATAAAEAMSMFKNLSANKNATKFFIDQETFPQTIDVIKTRAIPLGWEVVVGDYNMFVPNHEYFGAYVQYPNNTGNIVSYKSFTEKCHSANVLVCAGSDLLALTLLTPPADWGADCVIGSAQRFGVPMGFGGPHAAFFATKEEYKRQVPGRIIGLSIDANNDPALRMALQTREQHIRRQAATSNICTSQVLLAIMASMYAVYHGPKGLKAIASQVHNCAKTLDSAITALGFTQENKNYFDTIYINAGSKVGAIKTNAINAQINFRYFDNNYVGISVDETTSHANIQAIIDIFAKAADSSHTAILSNSIELTWGNEFIRTTDYMTHPVFNSHHSEHQMLRYIKHLESKDLSLCQSMISLGSCTMKLNATTEMIPVTWTEYNSLHPFCPTDQRAGYTDLLEEFSSDLAEITGFAGVSLQPNAGAQGEYTGLLVIREYFQNRGETHRNVALIPESAHGTNPASAVMAGMKVVVVKTDAKGNVDFEDLKTKAEANKDNLACLMITYPSTFGVFEEGVKDITNLIHSYGAQVYMDGANMNAQVGLTSPGNIGADVCHLNLHKTFCIPHGGGGPGMGPICVASHLKPFLPGHAVVSTGGDKGIGAVSAAPFGSASIILISYAYIKMMGGNGLKKATQIAILNANYMKARLETAYQTVYSGKNGYCAHEFILDIRPFKANSGIEGEDVAKRLMDYGFHAPTLSFPIPNTLMIEPTESESKEELDRFIDAMLSIKNEIQEIESGLMPKEDNVLVNAPHTAKSVIADVWAHAYSREKAAYPASFVLKNKFWATVARVNNTYGDRNLICACPPTEMYAEMNS
ncbi:MAG: aminomethyl-transferring glycine dehydrogenase [Bacteroidia bacterium]|nr:aminomethyl-transferring glycine dehydrogenase [Bacteroidia bacterium]